MKNAWKLMLLLPFALTAIGCADGADLPLDTPTPPGNQNQPPAGNENNDPPVVPEQSPPPVDDDGGHHHPHGEIGIYEKPEVMKKPDWEFEYAPPPPVMQHQE